MEYHLTAIEEFQALRKRFIKEVIKLYKYLNLTVLKIFIRLLEKKIELIADAIESTD